VVKITNHNFKDNMKASFQNVRGDILRIDNFVRQMSENLTSLSQGQARILDNISELAAFQVELATRIERLEKGSARPVRRTARKTVKRTIKRSSRKQAKFVVSKSTNKLHVSTCPFAKRVKPKNKAMFSSKKKALNEGYKPCDCMKKY